jgi:hypothetical protein
VRGRPFRRHLQALAGEAEAPEIGLDHLADGLVLARRVHARVRTISRRNATASSMPARAASRTRASSAAVTGTTPVRVSARREANLHPARPAGL